MIWQYLVCEYDRTNYYVVDGPHEKGLCSIHELGTEGWELVNISGWQLDRAIAIFKRPMLEIDSEGS